MKTLKIQEETHKRLTKLLGKMTAENGRIKTYDDVIRALIESHEKKGPRES